MKTKEFKLLIEGFNKYLLNENENEISEAKRKSLIAAVPEEFSVYLSDDSGWRDGNTWLAETDHRGNADSKADEELLFEEVAEACGCNVGDLLVGYYDAVENANELCKGFTLVDGTLCGEFKIGKVVVKGFYVDTVQKAVAAGLQFQSKFVNNQLKGLIFLAPLNKSSIESSLDFEGSAWNINEARIKESVKKKLGKRNNL